MKAYFRFFFPIALLLAAWLTLAGCGEDLDNARVQQLLAEGGTPAPPPPPGPTVTVVQGQFDRGTWISTGDHDPTSQLVASGWNAGIPGTGRAYFQFDLSTVSGTILSALLQLEVAVYNSPDFSESYALWDVSTPSATLATIPSNNINVFNDLGSGINYGTFSVFPTDVGTVIDIPLNSAAVADISAALGGNFALGFNGTSLISSPLANEFTMFALGTEARTHQLVLTVQ